MAKIIEWFKKYENFVVIVGLPLLCLFMYFWGKSDSHTKVETIEHTVYQDKIQIVNHTEFKDKIVEKKVYVHIHDKDISKNKKTTEVIKPDGTKVIVTQEQTNTKEHSQTNTQTDKQKDTQVNKDTKVSETKVVVDDKKTTVTSYEPIWRVAVTGGVDFHNVSIKNLVLQNPTTSPWVLGGELDHKLIGPIWGGVYANTSEQAGISLSLQL